MSLPKVLVLGGGPDSEREVSLQSSQGIADALTKAGHQVRREVIDRVSESELRALGGDVIFPALHGPWGEGGPLQDILARVNKPYVGCASAAARLAMDKLGSKLAAARAGVPTLPAVALNAKDDEPPLGIPCVIKPVHEGSSVGVHICTTRERWDKALIAVAAARATHPLRVNMVEQAVLSPREVTVGVLDGQALPVIEIKSAVEFYDYEAKYNRDDTQYVVNPQLPAGLVSTLQQRALAVASSVGVRHLCRVDFLLDAAGSAWFLEVNTMPGFTSHSLLPMAAKSIGLDFPALTSKLVAMALRDHR
ncbi:MAG TPA: D-alanine--D-alanine ligase [Phycisphaerales bacterium]|nr:D-alanine--D-alanine ligase [Phycisphaerales bacterium]